MIIFKKSGLIPTSGLYPAIEIDIRHANQLDVFHQAQYPDMVLSHIADADHTDPDGFELMSMQ